MNWILSYFDFLWLLKKDEYQSMDSMAVYENTFCQSEKEHSAYVYLYELVLIMAIHSTYCIINFFRVDGSMPRGRGVAFSR